MYPVHGHPYNCRVDCILPLGSPASNIVAVFPVLRSPMSTSNFPRRPIFRALACLAVGAVAASSCGRDITGLNGAALGSIVLKPLFQTTTGGDSGGFDQPVNLKIVVSVINPQAATPSARIKEISTAIIAFSSVRDKGQNADSVVVKATFPIQAEGSTYQVVVKGINATGDTTYSVGPAQFTSSQISGGTVSVAGQAVYVGPGSNATRVVIAPRGLTLFTNQPGGTLTAQAFLGTAALPLALYNWSSLNPSVANINSDKNQSVAVVGLGRGTARIVVRMEGSGVADTVTVLVLPSVAQITIVSGLGQIAKSGATFANPYVVRVGGSDGAPVSGATVTFAAQSGGSASPRSATTASDGTAQTFWTLGTGTTTQSLIITARNGTSTSFAQTTVTATPAASGASVYDGLYKGTWSGGQSNGSNLSGTVSWTASNGVLSGTTSAISGSTNTVSGTVSATGAVSGTIPATTGGCTITISGQMTLNGTGGSTASGGYVLVQSSTCNTASGSWTATRTP